MDKTKENEKNELKVIHKQEVLGKEFKIYGTSEQPLFLAKDVAEWIDYDSSSVNKMIKNVDEDEKITRTIVPNGSYKTEAWFLTEDGLYEVLMQSRKPIAKQFKKKVKVILKTIRKTGGYVNNEDQFINTYLPFADDQTKLLFRGTLETVRKQNEMIEQQQKVIEHKEDVIIGLVDEISLADKRQILNRVVRKNGNHNIGKRWSALYREFENKYHMNLSNRYEKYNKENKPKMRNKLDYIDKIMNKVPQLYEIACKLYENDVKELVDEMYELQNK